MKSTRRGPGAVSMRCSVARCALALVAALLTAGVSAVTSLAGPTQEIKVTFDEHFGGPVNSPFTCEASVFQILCASGEVVGLGRADEKIEFRACGVSCDVRTIGLADGSTLVLHETNVPGGVATPGNSASAPGALMSYGNPFTNLRTDVVVDGAGRFAGAAGELATHVLVAGGIAVINISGTITLP